MLGEMGCSGYHRCFRVKNINRAISRMRMGRAVGPNEIYVKFWKSTDKEGME